MTNTEHEQTAIIDGLHPGAGYIGSSMMHNGIGEQFVASFGDTRGQLDSSARKVWVDSDELNLRESAYPVVELLAHPLNIDRPINQRLIVSELFGSSEGSELRYYQAVHHIRRLFNGRGKRPGFGEIVLPSRRVGDEMTLMLRKSIAGQLSTEQQ